jgi:putative ABC transport system permease protein
VTGTASRSRLRRGLVVAEIALALPLLIASGLAAVGAQRVVNGPQGYDPDGAFRLRTMLPEATYQHGEARRIFAERLIAEALRQPGVEAAGTTTILPAAGSNQTRTIAIDGRPAGAEGLPTIDYRAVSSGYLSVMRIPIVQGRGFTDADREGADRTAIISQSAARRFWPNESPLGKRIQLGGAAGPWITVVGVCGDTMHDWFVGRWAPTVYVPVAQSPSVLVSLVLRTSGDPAALAAAGHAAVAAVDPRQPVFEAMTLREALRVRTTGLRFVGGLMAAFGGVALLLAAIGIYSVMAFFVTQRRHEMGIRVALGATSADVVRLTIGHGTRMAGLGIAIGLAAGIGLARVLESALFGVISLEPWLAASVTATLGAVALLASFVPARQAAAMDPVRALRQD